VLTISLDPWRLPEYALRTVLRMGAALVASLVFSLAYAALAAKSRQAEKILIPVLDILQSVPILGFLSITVTGFVALFPGRLLGVECAAIFAIFTSQAWNMTFSVYQSLRTVPMELIEAARMYCTPTVCCVHPTAYAMALVRSRPEFSQKVFATRSNTSSGIPQIRATMSGVRRTT